MYKNENLVETFEKDLDFFRVKFAVDFKKWSQKNINLQEKYNQMSRWLKMFNEA